VLRDVTVGWKLDIHHNTSIYTIKIGKLQI
jgi:hypothetical protein